MRKVIAVSLLLVFGLVLNSFAAKEEKQDNSAKAPAAAAVAGDEKKEVKTIFNFKDELGLTDKQVESIKTLLSDLQKTMNEKATALNKLREDLVKQIKDRVSLKEIKSKLQQIANLQVDASYIDIEISRKVENILSGDQLAKWKTIQQKAREEFNKEMASQAPKPAS